jgi:hypothetical protein
MLLALEKLNPSIVIEWDHKMVDGDTTIFWIGFWAFVLLI